MDARPCSASDIARPVGYDVEMGSFCSKLLTINSRAVAVGAALLAVFFWISLFRWIYAMHVAQRYGALASFFEDEFPFLISWAVLFISSNVSLLIAAKWPRFGLVACLLLPAISIAIFRSESFRNRGAQIHTFGADGHAYYYATWWISAWWLTAIAFMVVAYPIRGLLTKSETSRCVPRLYASSN